MLSQELNTAFVPSFTEFLQMVSLRLAGYTLYYTLTYMICFCFMTDVLNCFNIVLSTTSSQYSDLIDCALLGYAAPTKFGVTPG